MAQELMKKATDHLKPAIDGLVEAALKGQALTDLSEFLKKAMLPVTVIVFLYLLQQVIDHEEASSSCPHCGSECQQKRRSPGKFDT